MKQEEPLDPILQDWIEERDSLSTPAAGSARAHELFLLLQRAENSDPNEMSRQEAELTLARVRQRVARTSVAPLRVRDAWLAAAAVIFGIAIGYPLSLRSASVEQGAPRGGEIIKTSSFQILQSGRVVRFHLELKRTR